MIPLSLKKDKKQMIFFLQITDKMAKDKKEWHWTPIPILAMIIIISLITIILIIIILLVRLGRVKLVLYSPSVQLIKTAHQALERSTSGWSSMLSPPGWSSILSFPSSEMSFSWSICQLLNMWSVSIIDDDHSDHDDHDGDDEDDDGKSWSQVCNYTFSRPSTPFTIDSNGLLTLQVRP